MGSDDFFLFVSHVSEDARAALQVVDELERRGVRCWIAPRDVRPGAPFDDEIADAIEQCRAMLLIFSNRCNDNEYIRREITVAGNANKVILPFRIEKVEPKRALSVRLANLHWIDGFVAREKAIDEVVRAVQPSIKKKQKKKQDGVEETHDRAPGRNKSPSAQVGRAAWSAPTGRFGLIQLRGRRLGALAAAFVLLLIVGGTIAISFNFVRSPWGQPLCTDASVRGRLWEDFKPHPPWRYSDKTTYWVDNQLAMKPDPNIGEWDPIYEFVFTDATYCLDVKSPSDATDSEARGGLVFWLVDDHTFYVAEIYPDGSYGVRRAVKDTPTAIILPKRKFEKLNAGPSAVNQIKVTALNGVLTLFLNGELATQFRAEAPKDGGKVGFYAQSSQNQSNEWRFLDIAVNE
jgi:TIR domain